MGAPVSLLEFTDLRASSTAFLLGSVAVSKTEFLMLCHLPMKENSLCYSCYVQNGNTIFFLKAHYLWNFILSCCDEQGTYIFRLIGAAARHQAIDTPNNQSSVCRKQMP